MLALTTRQRDLLIALLNSEAPIGAEELAARLDLTPRQVKYDLKGISQWLSFRDVNLEQKPGVGIQIICSDEQLEQTKQDLASISQLQLILSSDERQQMLALFLLTVEASKYLSEIEELAQVSRTTVIKDLDAIEFWLNQLGLRIIRRPNYGIEVEEFENLRQKAITMVLWGETPFGKTVFSIDHHQGLSFSNQKDSKFNPLVEYCDHLTQSWNVKRVIPQISYIEKELGGHYPDDAVLHLSLVIALQAQRIAVGHHLDIPPSQIKDLQNKPVWRVAKRIAKRLGWQLTPNWQNIDIAGIAVWVLGSPRDKRFLGDLTLDVRFRTLIPEMMETIADLYESPEMSTDSILEEGLINHIIPACIRQKYDLWQPFPYSDFVTSKEFPSEHQKALQLGFLIEKKTGFSIPFIEISNIAALLRAARIRIRPFYFNEILVVCPGGMASAQLLMTRLEARFPRLGPVKAISVRELTDESIESADMIISTVPIAPEIEQKIKVIQVHPMLPKNDMERINKLIT
jgi:mannitol operon transcriptional antiterminator